MSYKFGFINENFQIETDLESAISLLDADEIKEILDSSSNANQFTNKLTEKISTKFHPFIRRDPGREMDEEMNAEVLELARDLFDQRKKKAAF